MNAPETKYLEDGNVIVTNARAVLKGKTFAMVNITSVSMGEVPPNRMIWIILALVGVAIAGCSLSSGKVNLGGVLGILLCIFGLVIAAGLKKQYAVRIGSAGGETVGLSSFDREYIQKIVNAINQAIVNRG